MRTSFGALAQLGERNTGSVEVSGSIPLGSTNPIVLRDGGVCYFRLEKAVKLPFIGHRIDRIILIALGVLHIVFHQNPKFAADDIEIKAPPVYDQDGLKTLIKTVVEEVVGQTLPVKKPSITLSELYRRYMDVRFLLQICRRNPA